MARARQSHSPRARSTVLLKRFRKPKPRQWRADGRMLPRSGRKSCRPIPSTRFSRFSSQTRCIKRRTIATRFPPIVGLPDVSKMSREEGWRADLALLAREVKRKGYAEGVYRALSKQDFDASVRKLDDAIPGLSDGQIVVEMMKLLRDRK